MLTPASVREIWNILVERARTASMAVIPVGCGTFVFSEEALAELPDGVPEPIRVLASGEELLRAAESG
jgi:hypothetical protein